MKNGGDKSLVDVLYDAKEGLESEMRVLGYSTNTIKSYMREIQYFINFCVKYDGEMDISDINRPIVLESMDYREKQSKDGKISPSTKEMYIKALKRLFAFIQDNIDDNRNYLKIFDKIKVRTQTKERDYLTDDEIERFKSVLEHEKAKGTKTAFRNVLLAKLLLYGGFRISEALNLKPSDFNDANHGSVFRISILGKGNKEAYVYIRKSVIEDELNEYLSLTGKSAGDHLFTTKKGRKLTRQEAYITISKLMRRAGINKKGLHILRHTLAMKLLREGVDIVYIQKMLRHAKISTTTVYARASEEDLIEIAKRLEPKIIKREDLYD